MRDFDRVREKIEIRLEPRQVVLLVVLTTVFSGGLFAAGFMAGRTQAPPAVVAPQGLVQLDAHARAARPEPQAEAPAPALGEVEFLFPTVLGSRPARKRRVAKPVQLPAEIVAPAPKKKAAVAPKPAEDAKLARAEAERAAADRIERELAAADKAKRAAKRAADEAEAREVARKAEAEKHAAAEKQAKAEQKAREDARAAAQEKIRIEAARIAVGAKRAAAEAVKRAAAASLSAAHVGNEPPKPVRPARRYTLQVKAAKDKAEADGFIAALKKAGFQPHTVLADIPGKGRFYRIRVGRFDSMDAARLFQRRYKLESGQPDGGFITDL